MLTNDLEIEFRILYLTNNQQIFFFWALESNNIFETLSHLEVYGTVKKTAIFFTSSSNDTKKFTSRCLSSFCVHITPFSADILVDFYTGHL